MQELFYEETAAITNAGPAKTKYYVIKTFSVISYVVAVAWLLINITIFPLEGNVLLNILFIAVPFALFLVSGILLGRIKDKFYVDYDYTFVTGSIRFSRVIKNVKRKNVLVFDTRNIEKIGRYGSNTFFRYDAMPDKKRIYLTSNVEPAEGKGFYYMVVNVNGQKYFLILECSELFLINILKFAGKLVFEDDFFNKKSGAK